MDGTVLVIGHRADLIHPFSDTENLVEPLPHAHLLPGRLPFGMRLCPTRLLGEIERFLEDHGGDGPGSGANPGLRAV